MSLQLMYAVASLIIASILVTRDFSAGKDVINEWSG